MKSSTMTLMRSSVSPSFTSEFILMDTALVTMETMVSKSLVFVFIRIRIWFPDSGTEFRYSMVAYSISSSVKRSPRPGSLVRSCSP